MITTSNKLWATAGAFALAATAVLVPVAQADPAGDTDSGATSDTSAASSDVGSSAGRSAARTNRGAASRAGTAGAGVSTPPESIISGLEPAAASEAPAASNTGSNPLFQNPLIWLGTPNPTPPPQVYTRTFSPLANLPGWTRGYYGWYENLNFEACVLGLSSTITVGPYGTTRNAISTGGC